MPDPQYLFQPVLFQAITPIHVGSGQDVGIVDLPVIRERTTDHPYIPGSGIRGPLRKRCAAADSDGWVVRIFGPEKEGEIGAGCLSVLDAHLLLFPVRSAPGLFHWITCPFVLERQRTLHRELVGGESALAAGDGSPQDGTYLGGPGGDLYLEEYLFSAGEGEWRWTQQIEGVTAQRVVLVSDADFLHFVRTATVVRQRNRLSTAKTVLRGQLFSVESLPAETRLLGYLGATEERVVTAKGNGTGEPEETRPEIEAPFSKEQVHQRLRTMVTDGEAGDVAHLVLGGDESVGQGITRLDWLALGAGSGGGEGA